MKIGDIDVYARYTACIKCGLPVSMHKKRSVKIAMWLFYNKTCHKFHKLNPGLLTVHSKK